MASKEDFLGLEEEILRSIRRIVRAIELHSRHLIHEVGLTAPQLSVLKTVGSLAPATPTRIARELSLSQPTVSGILERLASKGLVQRAVASGDKRLHAYTLTEQSEQALSSSPPLLDERFRNKLRRLEEWERSWILASLQRVALMMDADHLEAGPLLTTGVDVGGDAEAPPPTRKRKG